MEALGPYTIPILTRKFREAGRGNCYRPPEEGSTLRGQTCLLLIVYWFPTPRLLSRKA